MVIVIDNIVTVIHVLPLFLLVHCSQTFINNDNNNDKIISASFKFFVPKDFTKRPLHFIFYANPFTFL